MPTTTSNSGRRFQLLWLPCITALAANSANAQWLDDAAPYDRYGSAVAIGDFDGDGVGDLAVGIPGEDLGTAYNAGAVRVHYSLPGTGPDGGPGRKANQYLNEAILGSAPNSYAYFGSSLATGDFDGDSYDDLAVGAYGDDVSTFNQAGSVFVVYGGPSGLDTSRRQRLHQGSFANTGNPEAGDWFGFSLASADFDQNGACDLAVGAPRDDYTSLVTDSGVVNILYGEVGLGLAFSTQRQFFEENNVPAGTSEQGDQFGYALVAGNFDDDSYPDLAIGVPFEDTSDFFWTTSNHGRVYFLEGSSSGIRRPLGGQLLGAAHSPGRSVFATYPDSYFGTALASGNFGNGEPDFLVVGAPYQAVGTVPYAGRVHVFQASFSGSWGWTRQEWHQDSPGIAGGAESFDGFGSALAVGEVSLSGAPTLAIGVKNEALGNTAYAGVVHALYYDPNTGSFGSNGSQLWYQNSPGVPEVSEPSDYFGAALAMGDVSGEGFDDLIIGVSGEDTGGYAAAGAAHVLFGGGLEGFDGLTSMGTMLLHEWYATFSF